MRPYAAGGRRPTWPFQIHQGSWQARNLVAWFPYKDFACGNSYDEYFSPLRLAAVNGGGPIVTQNGIAFDSRGTDKGARATTPAHLKGLTSLTLVWTGVGSPGVAPSANATIFAITYDDAATSPFITYGIGTDDFAARRLRGEFTNSGGTFSQTTTNAQLHTGRDILFQIVFTITNNSQVLWLNGRQEGSSATGFTGGNAQSTSQTCIGINGVDLARSSEIVTLDARIYDRVWTEAEAKALWNNNSPWGLYLPTDRLRQTLGLLGQSDVVAAQRRHVFVGALHGPTFVG